MSSVKLELKLRVPAEQRDSVGRALAALGGQDPCTVGVALNDVEVEGQGDRGRWHELGFESASGSPALVFSLAEAWLRAHPGLWIDPVAKGATARRDTGADARPPSSKATTPAFSHADDAERVAREVVRVCVQQVLLGVAAVVEDHGSTEHVHQLRVGIRRLRTVLRELASLSPRLQACGGNREALEAPLRGVLQALGLSRDPQVRASQIEPQLAAAGAPLVSLPMSGEPPPSPADVVRRLDFQLALLALLAFAVVPAGSTSVKGSPRKIVRKRLSKLHGRIVMAAHRFEELPLEEQHKERKRLKRLRYLAELSSPLFDRRRAKRYLQALKPAQDILGQHNDDAVALAEFQQQTAADPRAWFAVGWLTARLARSACVGRKSLEKIDDAPHFWRRR